MRDPVLNRRLLAAAPADPITGADIGRIPAGSGRRRRAASGRATGSEGGGDRSERPARAPVNLWRRARLNRFRSPFVWTTGPNPWTTGSSCGQISGADALEVPH